MKKFEFKNQHSSPKEKNLNLSDQLAIIGGALSGTSGGALLGSPFGLVGGLIGSLIGGFFTGYSSYRELKKENNRHYR